MSARVATRTAARIAEHVAAHGKSNVAIIFHGGEPLLGGVRHLSELIEAIESETNKFSLRVSYGMQSNGLLFTPEIGDFLIKHRISIGISIDGPPQVNDRHRKDHAGNGSSVRLENRLALLSAEPYRTIFSGFLVVVDCSTDPIQVFDYLRQFSPRGIDFILPYDNHDRLPPGKAENHDATPYGDWMIRLFDHWFHNHSEIRVREFDSIIRQLLDGKSLVESIGTGPVDLIVVETNGDIEAVDSLKASVDGATRLGLTVFANSFDEAAVHQDILSRHIGSSALCETCQNCSIVEVCGGGYLPNRYSVANGFDNPSVYCDDLKKLISHISDTIWTSIDQAFSNEPA
jgi:uncharacterized protein